MKNRVLLAMLIIFIVLAGIWITCGTIFVVRDVTIVDETISATPLSDAEKKQISDVVNLKGKNVLFNLKTAQITTRVKDLNPMLKVHSVKVNFPNRVVIKVSRRVPFYWDTNNECYFDADMCMLDLTTPNYIDITGANLVLQDGIKTGDIAIGKNEINQRKIDQLRIVAGYITSGYFDETENFEISYHEDLYLRLVLKVGNDTTFEIRTAQGDNFAKIFAYVYKVYGKKNRLAGNYTALYNGDGKVAVKINGEVYHEE